MAHTADEFNVALLAHFRSEDTGTSRATNHSGVRLHHSWLSLSVPNLGTEDACNARRERDIKADLLRRLPLPEKSKGTRAQIYPFIVFMRHRLIWPHLYLCSKSILIQVEKSPSGAPLRVGIYVSRALSIKMNVCAAPAPAILPRAENCR